MSKQTLPSIAYNVAGEVDKAIGSDNNTAWPARIRHAQGALGT